ncbi:MAG: DNA primase, partial [Saprospiraceae bacterium]
DAIRYLAKKYGIELEETGADPIFDAAEQEKESLYLVNQFASQFFQKQLLETDEGKSVGLSYFKDRGYREDMIQLFQLGFAPTDRTALVKAATAKGYSIELFQRLGLVNKYDQDFFHDRIMFPIHSPNGKIVAFAGRYLQKTANSPKYINSPETEIYNKSKVLFGMYFARNAIRKQNKVYLVEGYTDVITLFQAGIENVVASSGTSLTIEQIRLIRRYTHDVTMLYDGDKAGVKAALRGVDLLLQEDLNVRIVQLPESEDPDSYIRKFGAQAFHDYSAAEEKDFVLFKTGLLLEESGNDPIRKTQMLKDIVSSIALIPDTIKRSVYIKECAQRFGISEKIFVEETQKVIRQQITQKRQGQIQTALDQSQSEKAPESWSEWDKNPDKVVIDDDFQERDVVRVLISMGHLPYDAEAQISVASYMLTELQDHLDQFNNSNYRSLIEHYAQLFEEGNATPEKLVNDADPIFSQMVINFITSPYEYSENWEKKWEIFLQNQLPPAQNQKEEAKQVILRLRLRKIMKLIKENQEILSKSKDLETTEIDRHLKAHQMLVQMRNEVASELSTILL